MKYRKLDAQKDYSFGQGLQDFYEDTDAVAQAVSTNLKLLQGEWWEDTSDGLPLFQQILGRAFKKDAADMIVRSRILATEGVASISSFTSIFANRKYSVSCAVTTSAGGAATIGVNF